MANSVSGTIGATASFTLTSAQGLAPAAASTFNEIITIPFASGTGSKQADMVWSVNATVATTSSPSTYQFSGGNLKDAFGGNFNPAKMKALMLYASSTNAGNVVVGNNANHVPVFSAAAQSIPVQPGAVFLWAVPGTGVTVTANTGDIVQVAVAAAGNTLTYDLIALCTSV